MQKHGNTPKPTRKAWTRNGRRVIEIKKSILDGKAVLTGMVQCEDIHKDRLIHFEPRWWSLGGLGSGPDDLVMEKPEQSKV